MQCRSATRTMKDAVGGPLLVGLIMAYFGLILIALAVWHALWTIAQAIMHSASGLLSCAGQCVTVKKNPRSIQAAPSATHRNSSYLLRV
jgi:hypothetical protein